MPLVHHRDRPQILSASGHPSLSMVVNAEVGAKQLSVWVGNHAPGELVPLHTHEYEEVTTIISGNARVTVGSEVFEVSGDASVLVPAGVPHGYENVGSTPLRVIAALPDPEAKRGKLWQGNPSSEK